MREWGHDRYKGRALFWPSLARNKMSVSLNLRSEAGQQLLKELVADADVLIENFRPGTLEKWGIGPLGHGLHALAIYDERVFGGQPRTRATELASIHKLQKKTIER